MSSRSISRVWGMWLCVALALAGCDVVWRIDGAHPSTADGPSYAWCGDHDEDGDGFNDGCDACPGVKDDQLDGDGDGVGDACDPSDTTQNTLALFVSFAEDPPRWTPVTGSWTTDGESLRYESITLDLYGVTLRDGMLPEPPYLVDAHLDIDSIGPTGALQAVFDSDATGDGSTCGVLRRAGPSDVVHASNPNGAPAAQLAINPLGAGGYRIGVSYDRAGTIRCTFTADDKTTGGTAMVAIEAPPPATGGLAIRSIHVGATVHYLAFYK